MVCPNCKKEGDCRVENTRHACGLIVRYRRCPDCRRRFRTREIIDRGQVGGRAPVFAGERVAGRISAGTGNA